MAASAQGVNASTIVSVSSDSVAEKVNQASTMIESMAEAEVSVLAEFLINTAGFHAWDILADPISEVDLSRVLIRALDADFELYSNCPIKE